MSSAACSAASQPFPPLCSSSTKGLSQQSTTSSLPYQTTPGEWGSRQADDYGACNHLCKNQSPPETQRGAAIGTAIKQDHPQAGCGNRSPTNRNDDIEISAKRRLSEVGGVGRTGPTGTVRPIDIRRTNAEETDANNRKVATARLTSAWAVKTVRTDGQGCSATHLKLNVLQIDSSSLG